MYTFYLKSLKLDTLQCFSLEFHFRNANALGPDTVIYLLIYLSTHLPVPLCLPVAHSSSLSVLCPSPGTQDSPTCPALPLAHMPVCIHIHKVHVHAYRRWQCSAALTAAKLGATVTLLLALLALSNPVCSQQSREVSALEASTICTLTLLDWEHCGAALLRATESDLISTLAFCQQRLRSDKRSGSRWQTNLLLYVSCRQI